MEGGSVRIWDWLTAIAGLALAVGDFIPFYRSNEENWSAWSVFMLIDKLMLITAVMALLLPLIAALKATDKQALKLVIAIALLGALCVIFVIYRMATPAELADPTFHLPVKLQAGAFVSLIAAIVLTASSLLAIRSRLARRARV
ncbi:MAG: hypothetical protein QOG63_2705 [Thermoleophilaceae bacterium]|jgi:hypothetical protein|nr:hypothetical protein [Thermoleophilaceae bacterium]